MNIVEMDEMMGQFCVDIVEASDIFEQKHRTPKLCQATRKGSFRFVYFWCPASEDWIRLVLFLGSEILSLE